MGLRVIKIKWLFVKYGGIPYIFFIRYKYYTYGRYDILWNSVSYNNDKWLRWGTNTGKNIYVWEVK